LLIFACKTDRLLENGENIALFCIQNTAMNGNVIDFSGSTLQQRVAKRLRQMLVEGAIAPGAKLNERELSEALSTPAQAISRTPLREAIRTLAAEGLVELLPNRGAIAVQLTEADVLHTFEVVAGLEGTSGELAAQRITPDELAEVRAMHYEMLAAHARRDLSRYYTLNAQIHRAINTAAKNPVLTATYEQVNARLQALRFRTNQNEAKWQAAIDDHERMLKALTERDAPAARAVLMAHLYNKRDTVVQQMRQAAQAADPGPTKGTA
jgi:DNA-binding GntR family transcriptional regulator